MAVLCRIFTLGTLAFLLGLTGTVQAGSIKGQGTFYSEIQSASRDQDPELWPKRQRHGIMMV